MKPERTNPLRVLALGSGVIGHEINLRGVAQALGGPFEFRRVSPRWIYGRLAPWGPVDPRDRNPFKSPPPDVVLASGRVTAPYLSAWRRVQPDVFTVFLQDPRWRRRDVDLIWAPEHDALRGENVIATLTSPHPFSPARLAAERAAPDARIAALKAPRCAILLGGPSGSQHFTPADISGLAAAVGAIRAQGYSPMATPSRRTPPELSAAVRAAVGDGFFWEGEGANPYASILANADAILVTGDSANMVGEATATGAPVHVFAPSGGRSAKLDRAIDRLVGYGAARRWAGRIERFTYYPLDSSAEIASEILRRFAARRRLTA